MENPNAIRGIIRGDSDYKTPVERYTDDNQRFVSIQTIHGGCFKRRNGLRFTGNSSHIFDWIDVGDLSFRFVERMLISVGFQGQPFLYYQHPKEDFHYGMIKLQTPADFARFQCTIWPGMWRTMPTIFAESITPTIPVSYPMSLLDATRGKMVKIFSLCISKNPHIQAEGAQAILLKEYGIAFPLAMIEGVRDETVIAVWGKRMESWCLGS